MLELPRRSCISLLLAQVYPNSSKGPFWNSLITLSILIDLCRVRKWYFLKLFDRFCMVLSCRHLWNDRRDPGERSRRSHAQSRREMLARQDICYSGRIRYLEKLQYNGDIRQQLETIAIHRHSDDLSLSEALAAGHVPVFTKARMVHAPVVKLSLLNEGCLACEPTWTTLTACPASTEQCMRSDMRGQIILWWFLTQLLMRVLERCRSSLAKRGRWNGRELSKA